MMSIWKFSLAITDNQVVEMPAGQVLSIGVQRGNPHPQLWSLVDVDGPKIKRRFRTYGTGHPVDEIGRFIGTYQLDGGALVFHVFEVNV